MPPDNDLHLMVGEIRSDVKQLLAERSDTNKRLGSLEKKWWTTLAALGILIPVSVAKAFGWH